MATKFRRFQFMEVAGSMRLVAQPGGLTLNFAARVEAHKCQESTTGGGTYSADTAIAVPLLKVVRLIM